MVKAPRDGLSYVGAALALLMPLLLFVVSSAYAQRLAAKLDEASLSVATNGGPSVVYLSSMNNAVRRIEEQALLVRPGSVAVTRARIAALQDDFDRAEAGERATPDYPGEHEAFLDTARLRPRFFSAVDRILDRASEGLPAREADVESLRATANDLADATMAWSKLNADGLGRAAEDIVTLRRRLAWLLDARDALAFAFVLVGTALGIRAALQQAALAEERRRLDQERVAELDAFAGRVAHDLRDMLSVIFMRASRGEHATTLPAATEALTRITQKAQRMSATIDALLGFARAAARPAAHAESRADAVVKEVVADARFLAGEAGTEIVVEPLRAEAVACDAAVLRVVLSNLVRNALKYGVDGGHGAPRITVRGSPRGEGLFRFEVEDTGPGLPPGSEDRVFEPFVRVGDGVHGKDGIGLGLATVKRLVEANGGEVGVESRQGEGCRFWFTLPRAA